MGGQHDAELLFGDGLHQVLQELPPGERVEARDRLVEDEQLGPLRDAQGERELRTLAAGQLPGPLPRVQAELLDPRLRQGAVPARVEPRAETQMVGDAQPAYVGVSWATNPTFAS